MSCLEFLFTDIVPFSLGEYSTTMFKVKCTQLISLERQQNSYHFGIVNSFRALYRIDESSIQSSELERARNRAFLPCFEMTLCFILGRVYCIINKVRIYTERKKKKKRGKYVLCVCKTKTKNKKSKVINHYDTCVIPNFY